jgi:serine/threonine-protein phosphatase PP1 catalytic subunit
MKKHNLFLVCRAHQMVNEGYKFFGGNKLITIFSAPNYCGEMGNNGAVMYISTSLECSFIILKPIKKK